MHPRFIPNPEIGISETLSGYYHDVPRVIGDFSCDHNVPEISQLLIDALPAGDYHNVIVFCPSTEIKDVVIKVFI